MYIQDIYKVYMMYNVKYISYTKRNYLAILLSINGNLVVQISTNTFLIFKPIFMKNDCWYYHNGMPDYYSYSSNFYFH